MILWVILNDNYSLANVNLIYILLCGSNYECWHDFLITMYNFNNDLWLCFSILIINLEIRNNISRMIRNMITYGHISDLHRRSITPNITIFDVIYVTLIYDDPPNTRINQLSSDFKLFWIDDIISIFFYQRSNDREPRSYDIIDFHLLLSLDNLFTGMFCRKLDY